MSRIDESSNFRSISEADAIPVGLDDVAEFT